MLWLEEFSWKMWLLCILAGLGVTVGTGTEICLTRCDVPGGKEGCCPYPDATCCDGTSCCPNGMQCDTARGICKSGLDQEDIQLHYPSALNNSAVEMLSNVYCPDHSECPDQNTCCPLSSGRYGCCPRPNAVCCSDELHCCPHGYTCLGQGYCRIGNNLMYVMKAPPSNEEVNVLQYSTCGSSQTSCQSNNGARACCPLQSAVCCSDGQHCCPLGYKCLPGSQSCIKELWSGIFFLLFWGCILYKYIEKILQ